MKLVLDVPGSLFERLQRAVAHGRFDSIGQFATVAIENQLSLEQPAPSGASTVGSGPVSIPGVRGGGGEESPLVLRKGIETRTVDSGPAAGLSVEEHGWIWGMVNRVFPIKVAARSLLLDSADGAAALHDARQAASERAELVARWLSSRYGNDAPSRDESLLTGLPVREPLYRSRERFADHFFGRLDGSGRSWGALFELGLAGVENVKADSPRVLLTAVGARFASLTNPVLDAGELSVALSAEETDLYLQGVVTRVPRERHSFEVILGALASKELSTEGLSNVAQQNLPKTLTDAAIQTMKAGTVGRMIDLELITRLRTGRTVRFGITNRGERVMAALGEVNQREPGKPAKKEGR